MQAFLEMLFHYLKHIYLQSRCGECSPNMLGVLIMKDILLGLSSRCSLGRENWRYKFESPFVTDPYSTHVRARMRSHFLMFSSILLLFFFTFHFKNYPSKLSYMYIMYFDGIYVHCLLLSLSTYRLPDVKFSILCFLLLLTIPIPIVLTTRLWCGATPPPGVWVTYPVSTSSKQSSFFLVINSQ